MSEISEQVTQVLVPLYLPLVILSVVAFLGATGWLWRKGKTVEGMLVWVSLWLYIIAVILFLNPSL